MKIYDIKDEFGRLLFGQHAEIVPHVSIRIFGDNPQRFDKVFNLGDNAWIEPWDYGPIVKIGRKTITILSKKQGRLIRLSLFEFYWKNFQSLFGD